MIKIFDIGFGRKTLYELYKSSYMSSRLQYGLAQLEDKYHIKHISWAPFTIKGLIKNNLSVLRQCDVVYMTYLYVQPVLLLALLRRCGLYRRRKLLAISHVPLRDGRNKIESMILRTAYGAFDRILFHSQKNMEESINKGLINRKLCEFLFWGDDLEYIDSQIRISHGNFFLSTGREHRDFFTLANAFGQRPQIPLEIYTNLYNYDNDYLPVTKLKDVYQNVKITFVEKSAETTKFLAQKAGDCFCVVVPVEKEGMYYCIGLTSVVEAMAMSKPIISTRNPNYPIDIEKEGIGLYADDEKSWVKAIDYLYLNPEIAAEMGRKGRILAEKKFNIRSCSQLLDRLINE